MLPVAVDAMGGDNAPAEIVEGAKRAAAELGAAVALVGRPEEIEPMAGGLEVIPAAEAIAMDADPGSSVRRMKDSSLVRAAEAVRDGRACAMISAGNTGATVVAALLRLGRIPGVARPAIATPIPVPGHRPTVLLDAGANVECQPDWLVQFAQMGAVFAKQRYGATEPRIGLLSIGEESTKGTPLVRAAHAMLAEPGALSAVGARFVGNVEGRDLMAPGADVVVTDGFTGNVALKTLEGSLGAFTAAAEAALGASEDIEIKAAAQLLRPALAPVYASFDPHNTGAAMLLGVQGLCLICHGSSTSTAILNAVRVATELAQARVIDELRSAFC